MKLPYDAFLCRLLLKRRNRVDSRHESQQKQRLLSPSRIAQTLKSPAAVMAVRGEPFWKYRERPRHRRVGEHCKISRTGDQRYIFQRAPFLTWVVKMQAANRVAD